jgi:ABC-type multidrug transport system fused ATPase/permease subunit
MTISQNKLRFGLYGLFVFASLLIVTDFVLPGGVVVDEIIDVEKERQQYYNAARNYHFSYRVYTSSQKFSVTEDFAVAIKDNLQVEYSVSRIFKEVNYYSLLNSGKRETYSMRFLSGLVIPSLVIMVLGIAFKYDGKMGILVFVIQVLLIIDLIFLIK